MGVAFKERLIPHAVRWFTGESLDEEEYEESTALGGSSDEDEEEQEVRNADDEIHKKTIDVTPNDVWRDECWAEEPETVTAKEAKVFEDKETKQQERQKERNDEEEA